MYSKKCFKYKIMQICLLIMYEYNAYKKCDNLYNHIYNYSSYG